MRSFITSIIIIIIAVLCLVLAAQQSGVPAASATQARYNAQVDSTQRKFDYVRQNGAKKNPDPKPTIINQNELNTWLASPNADLPKGVEKLQLSGDSGRIHAVATVDFDKITAGNTSRNPLLMLFSGTHQVEADARGEGANGIGKVHITSVSIDGVNVPKMAMQYFVDRYIKPKYPNLGIDSRFNLPYKINTAEVGQQQLTIVQN